MELKILILLLMCVATTWAEDTTKSNTKNVEDNENMARYLHLIDNLEQLMRDDDAMEFAELENIKKAAFPKNEDIDKRVLNYKFMKQLMNSGKKSPELSKKVIDDFEIIKDEGLKDVNVQEDHYYQASHPYKNNLFQAGIYEQCHLFSECTDKLHYARDKIIDLKMDAKIVNAQYQWVAKERKLLQLKNKILELKVKDATSATEKNNEIVQTDCSSIENKLKTCHDKESATNDNLNSCMQELKVANKKINDIKNNVHTGTKETNLESLKVEFDNCKYNLTLAEETIEEILDDFDQCDLDLKQCKTTTPTCTSCESNLKECKTKSTESSTQISSLMTDISTCQSNISTITDKITNIDNELSVCRKNALDSVGIIGNLNTDLESCRQVSKNAVNNITELNNNLIDCNKNLGNIDECKSNLENCKTNATTSVTQLKNLQVQLTSCQVNASGQQTTVNNLLSQNLLVAGTCNLAVNDLNLIKSPSNHIYYFASSTAEMQSWFSAEKFCKSHSMELVSVETAIENTWIKNKVQSIFRANNVTPGPTAWFWTGLESHNKENEWYWAGTGQVMSFADFARGQPNSVETDRCGTINWSSGDTKWTNEYCFNKARFICELRKPCSLVVTVNNL